MNLVKIKCDVDYVQAIVHTMLEDKEEGEWRRGNKEAMEWRKAFIKTF